MPIFLENRDRLLLDHIRNLLRRADKAYFALAFVRHSGVNLLKADIEALLKRKGSVQVLFANDFGATEASAVETLREIGVSLKFYSDAFSFHPKSYIFQNGKSVSAIIGSSNLSASGLCQGIEWNVLLRPQDMDCSSILNEFSKLWQCSNAKLVTDDIVAKIERERSKRAIHETLRQYDRYPRIPSTKKGKNALTGTRNYIVRRTPDSKSAWAYQIYKGKLEEFAKQGQFNVVAIADYQTSQERVFVMPYAYLKENIIPYAHCDEKGRYIFEISKQSFRFNWHHSIGMDGNQFLAK
jgi:HKD family nuclease